MNLDAYFARLGIPYATMRDYAQAARDDYHNAYARNDAASMQLAADVTRRVMRLIRTDITIWDD